MQEDFNYIKVNNEVNQLLNKEAKNYVAHVLCYSGELKIIYNGEDMILKNGSGMIVRSRGLLENALPSNDCSIRAIYITPDFIEVCTPRNNYGIRGSIDLYTNPVIEMDREHFNKLDNDFTIIEQRLKEEHFFKRDIIICAVETMFLDYFNAHANIKGMIDIPFRDASIISRFIRMLQDGEYLQHKEVSYYADKLCITSKYLSEVCKSASGQPPTYWIARFTTVHIRRLLRDKELSIDDICNITGFNSISYFNRFVVKNLGSSPSKFRE